MMNDLCVYSIKRNNSLNLFRSDEHLSFFFSHFSGYFSLYLSYRLLRISFAVSNGPHEIHISSFLTNFLTHTTKNDTQQIIYVHKSRIKAIRIRESQQSYSRIAKIISFYYFVLFA